MKYSAFTNDYIKKSIRKEYDYFPSWYSSTPDYTRGSRLTTANDWARYDVYIRPAEYTLKELYFIGYSLETVSGMKMLIYTRYGEIGEAFDQYFENGVEHTLPDVTINLLAKFPILSWFPNLGPDFRIMGSLDYTVTAVATNLYVTGILAEYELA